MRRLGLIVVLTLVACGDHHATTDASVPADAGVTASPPSIEIVTGAGHATGGTLAADVEVGHAVMQTTISGGTLELQGAAVIERGGE